MQKDKPIIIEVVYPEYTTHYIYQGPMDLPGVTNRVIEECKRERVWNVSAIQFSYWEGLNPVGHNLQTGEMVSMKNCLDTLIDSEYMTYHYAYQLSKLVKYLG